MTIQDIVNASWALNRPRFSAWLLFVLNWECELDSKGQVRLEDVPGDHGGLTFAGIDSASHPDFPFHNPTPSIAARVYFEKYWVKSKAEDFLWPVGEVVANFAVNMGCSAANVLLQVAANTMGAKLTVDGVVGPKTMSAVSSLNPLTLADKIEDEADARYRRIVQANLSQRKFLQGWLNRDDALEKWWMDLAHQAAS